MNKLILFCVSAIFVFSQTVSAKEAKNMKVFQEAKSPEGVIARAELSKESYFILEPVELEIVITNTSNNNILLILGAKPAPASIKIVDTATKKEVPLTLYGEKLENPPFFMNVSYPLEPSGSDKYNLLINRLFDLSLVATYELECEVFYLDHDKNKLSLKTKPLKFSIVEKAH